MVAIQLVPTRDDPMDQRMYTMNTRRVANKRKNKQNNKSRKTLKHPAIVEFHELFSLSLYHFSIIDKNHNLTKPYNESKQRIIFKKKNQKKNMINTKLNKKLVKL